MKKRSWEQKRTLTTSEEAAKRSAEPSAGPLPLHFPGNQGKVSFVCLPERQTENERETARASEREERESETDTHRDRERTCWRRRWCRLCSSPAAAACSLRMSSSACFLSCCTDSSSRPSSAFLIPCYYVILLYACIREREGGERKKMYEYI